MGKVGWYHFLWQVLDCFQLLIILPLFEGNFSYHFPGISWLFFLMGGNEELHGEAEVLAISLKSAGFCLLSPVSQRYLKIQCQYWRSPCGWPVGPYPGGIAGSMSGGCEWISIPLGQEVPWLHSLPPGLGGSVVRHWTCHCLWGHYLKT